MSCAALQWWWWRRREHCTALYVHGRRCENAHGQLYRVGTVRTHVMDESWMACNVQMWHQWMRTLGP